MNGSYDEELQLQINTLLDDLVFTENQLRAARETFDTEEYARLMRVFLPLQKQYLKLCAEQEKRLNDDENADELEAFNKVTE
jgi:hypothetical protein